MYKVGNRFEKFSELFIFHLGTLLGFDMAIYEKTSCGVKTKDFTNNLEYCFEPAYSIVGDNDDTRYSLEKIEQIAPQCIPDFIQMVYLDALVRNFDRHTFNYGFLRNPETGDIVKFAPNFDNNNALVSRGYINSNPSRKNDVLVGTLNAILEENPQYRDYLPSVTKTIILEAIKRTKMKIKKKHIVDFVMNAFYQINL